MMELLQLIIGILIVIVVVMDFLYTIFLPKGAGILTAKINGTIAFIFSKLARNRGDNRLLEYTWLIIILAMFLTWVAMIWLGTTLIFSFDSHSIIHGQDKTPASFIQKLYFTGYTLSTLGNGDYVPNGKFWEIFTTIISFSGLILVTMGITYIVPVINNIIEKKSLSLNISSLGETSYDMVSRSFNGKNFKEISGQLLTLSNMIFRYSQNHLAYPILHDVHNPDKFENTILRLVSLDEALTIFIYHIPIDMRPPWIVLQQVRGSLDSYLMSVKNIEPARQPPQIPDLKSIETNLNISLVCTEKKEMEEVYGELSARRRLLKGIIEHDGWTWKDLQGDKFRPANFSA